MSRRTQQEPAARARETLQEACGAKRKGGNSELSSKAAIVEKCAQHRRVWQSERWRCMPRMLQNAAGKWRRQREECPVRRPRPRLFKRRRAKGRARVSSGVGGERVLPSKWQPWLGQARCSVSPPSAFHHPSQRVGALYHSVAAQAGKGVGMFEAVGSDINTRASQRNAAQRASVTNFSSTWSGAGVQTVPPQCVRVVRSRAQWQRVQGRTQPVV